MRRLIFPWHTTAPPHTIPPLPAMHRKLTAEFVGTFFLVIAALGGSGPLAPAAVLAGLIWSLGHLSGAHFNPAVSLAFWLRGRLSRRELFSYTAVQMVAALAGTLVFVGLNGGRDAASPSYPYFRAFAAETAFTFLLVTVILQVASARPLAGNGFYGAAIALTVLGGALTVGAISGAAFNPAVATAAILAGKIKFLALPGFFIAHALGGAGAAILFRILHPED